MGNQMTAGHQSAATHWVIGIAMMIIAITFNKSNIIIIIIIIIIINITNFTAIPISV